MKLLDRNFTVWPEFSVSDTAKEPEDPGVNANVTRLLPGLMEFASSGDLPLPRYVNTMSIVPPPPTPV
ncbi:MAG: hypothetical protein WDO73_03840 [Ignavibacteriota bacterium]